MNQRVAIVFSSNDYFIPYMSVMIASVMEHASNRFDYEIFLLHSGVSEDCINGLHEQISAKSNFEFRPLNLSEEIEGINFFEGTKRILSAESYYRLLIPYLLDDYDRAIYLDGDMVALADIAELAEEDLGDNLLAAVRDFLGVAEVHNPESERRSYIENVLGIDNCDECFISGLLVMNLNAFRESFSRQEILDLALSRNWEYHDQDVANKLAYGRTKLLDAGWNVLQDYGNNYLLPKELLDEWRESLKSPKVVHYGGDLKPWRLPRVPRAKYFWKYAKLSPFYEDIKMRRRAEWKENPRYRIRFCLQLLFPLGRTGRKVLLRIAKPIWTPLKRMLFSDGK